MTDLRETSDRRVTTEIDKVGWMFAVAVVVITAMAGMVGYYGWDATVAPKPPIAAFR